MTIIALIERGGHMIFLNVVISMQFYSSRSHLYIFLLLIYSRHCFWLSCLLKQLLWWYVIRAMFGWLVLFGRSSSLTHTWWVNHAGTDDNVWGDSWWATKGECLTPVHTLQKQLITKQSPLDFLVPFRNFRNIVRCLKQILDVLLVLLFVVAIFALMGKVPSNYYD